MTLALVKDKASAEAGEEALDRVFFALSDPVRRQILRRLDEGPALVSELAEPFDMSLEAVSKHIRVLEGARLVRRRRAGREHFLELAPEPLEQLANWIETQRASWTARLAALDELLKTQDRAAAGASQRSRQKRGPSR